MTVPIKAVARELGLTTHPLDTFTGWDPPSPYDLVIAVSFGLLVPARILDGTTYGGLNVHPSMLPDLRGAAPIQHTILGGRHFAGVSVQTMHPQKIDYGKVIAQTPSPGIKISHELSTEELTNQLAPVGAALLRDSIDQGLFVRPRAIRNEIHMNPRGLEPAPKIKPEDGRINWEKWTANRILRAGRAIGHLWDATMIQRYAAISQEIRVTFDGKWRLVAAKDIEVVKSSDPVRAGDPVRVIPSGTEQAEIAFATMDGQYVAPESITVAGKGKGKGSAHLLRLMKHM
jgi:methionyl-tRNA formyltransferase